MAKRGGGMERLSPASGRIKVVGTYSEAGGQFDSYSVLAL
jgi:hypothetical protein